MKLIGIAIAALLFLAGQATAQTDYILNGVERLGGNPYAFLAQVRMYRERDVRVVVKDQCVSSCTLYTSLLPDGLICALPGAKFIFHRFNILSDIKTDPEGHILSFKIDRPLVGEDFTRIWLSYPLSVRKRIIRESPQGIPRWGQELVVPATDLVPTC